MYDYTIKKTSIENPHLWHFNYDIKYVLFYAILNIKNKSKGYTIISSISSTILIEG